MGLSEDLKTWDFSLSEMPKEMRYNDRIMNFVPSLTKQHHYNLANIYVYQAQPNVLLGDETLLKDGRNRRSSWMYFTISKNNFFGW
jgi:hypothetical protein